MAIEDLYSRRHVDRLEEEINTLKQRVLIYKNAYLQLQASVRGAHKGIARLKRKLESRDEGRIIIHGAVDWWLSEGKEKFYGAPGWIFAARELLDK